MLKKFWHIVMTFVVWPFVAFTTLRGLYELACDVRDHFRKPTRHTEEYVVR